MNEQEWNATCAWMEACLRGDITEEQEVVYKRFLFGQDRCSVMAAIDTLVLDGNVFLPSPGEVLRAMQPPVPTFQVVWSMITPVLRSATVYGERRSVEMIREACGDLIGGWVASYGAVKLALEPVFDPDVGGVVMQRLQRSWHDATCSHQQRTLTSSQCGALQPAKPVYQLSDAA